MKNLWPNMLLVIVGLSLVSCDETQSEASRDSGLGSSSDYEVAYKLDPTQQTLVGQYISRYSSSVNELLSGAGIGYVDDDGEEVFEAHLEDDAIHVVGNRSIHSKVEIFLSDYFDREYLEALFAETEESNREWGVESTSAEQVADDQPPARDESEAQ